MKILYICTDFPYPPVHGGLVDMWNRIQALHGLGVTLDVIATVGAEPNQRDKEKVAALTRRLLICPRMPGKMGILSIKPGHTAIRRDLRNIQIDEHYDVVLMHTEFTSEILLNKTLKYDIAIVRVDNDEYAFHLQAAKAERSWLRKLYFVQEALRIRLHTYRVLPSMGMLWFISHDELVRYKIRHDRDDHQRIAFVPSAIDLRLLTQQSLLGSQVLFVGNLWTQFNREAIEWYVKNVHPRMTGFRDYRLVIAGSTRHKGCEWLSALLRSQNSITTHLDPEDLSPLYASSAVFINPMQRGAGVKLKTIEAILQGLPVVSTAVGAEGSGLVDGAHYQCANSSDEFGAHIRHLLTDKESAREFVRRSQAFITEHYDQQRVLGSLLREVSEWTQPLGSIRRNNPSEKAGRA